MSPSPIRGASVEATRPVLTAPTVHRHVPASAATVLTTPSTVHATTLPRCGRDNDPVVGRQGHQPLRYDRAPAGQSPRRAGPYRARSTVDALRVRGGSGTHRRPGSGTALRHHIVEQQTEDAVFARPGANPGGATPPRTPSARFARTSPGDDLSHHAVEVPGRRGPSQSPVLGQVSSQVVSPSRLARRPRRSTAVRRAVAAVLGVAIRIWSNTVRICGMVWCAACCAR